MSAELLSIVIPLFNEEDNIGPLFSRVQRIQQHLSPLQTEIIFVDDGSADQTSARIRELCKQHKNVRLIRLATNAGSHAAIMAGIAAGSGKCLMFLAGDLQDPPELIVQMVQQWRGGNRIVWAARQQAAGTRRRDSLFSALYWRMVIGLNGLSIPKSGVDFFLIDRTVADMVIPRVHSSAPSFLLVGQTGVSATVVHYTKGERVAGKSGWTLRKKLGLFVGTALCSRVPAKILGALGLADRGPRFVIAEQINFDQVLSGACPTTPTLAAVNR